MRSVVVIVALGLGAACGKTHAPGKSPRETVKNLEAALRAHDAGGAYDMLTARAQRGLTARDTLVEWMDDARGAKQVALRPYASLQLVVMDERRTGATARVRVSRLFNGVTQTFTLPFAREGGAWKLDTPFLLSDLAARIRPNPAACFT
jgi:hypothetical protein